MLDEWRVQRAPDAPEKHDRMGDTTQSHFQTRLKCFLEWATHIRLIEANPEAALDHISASKERIQGRLTADIISSIWQLKTRSEPFVTRLCTPHGRQPMNVRGLSN